MWLVVVFSDQMKRSASKAKVEAKKAKREKREKNLFALYAFSAFIASFSQSSTSQMINYYISHRRRFRVASQIRRDRAAFFDDGFDSVADALRGLDLTQAL